MPTKFPMNTEFASIPNPSVNTIVSEDFPSNGFNIKIIIRLIIGAVLLVGVVLLIVMYILPRFFPPTNQKVTLQYWGLWEDPRVISSIISDFKRIHPNIDVQYKKQDIKTLGSYREFLVSRTQNNTGPDIFRFHNSWVFRLKNILLPLPSDVIAKTEIDTKYYSVVKNDLKINGAYYGVPLGMDTLSLFINQDIFKAAGIDTDPATWDDLIRVARKLTVKDQTGKITTSGVALGTFDNIAHASDIVSLLFIQNGADIFDLSGKKRKNAEDALDFYTCFALDKPPDCVKVWDNSFDDSKLSFTKGNVAMYFGYSWDIFEIKAANPSLSFKIVPVPHLAGSSAFRNNTIASYWADGISQKTKYPKESFEFLSFLAKKENLEKMFTEQSKVRLFGEPYPRIDMKDSLKTNQFVYPFVLQADNATSTIFSSDTYDTSVNAVLNGYLGNAIKSILSGSFNSPSAIDTLAQGVSKTIGAYGK